MKKLRLIKPWQLRTIRQRLCDERTAVQEVGYAFTPCRGPVPDATYCAYLENGDVRFTNTFCENNAYAVKAPVSNLIFVPANIRGNLN